MIPGAAETRARLHGRRHGGGRKVFGPFATVWGLMQFIFSPLLGSLSDRYGRRPVILLSCFGLGLDYRFMAIAPPLALLFVSRVISGIISATIGTRSGHADCPGSAFLLATLVLLAAMAVAWLATRPRLSADRLA